MELGIVGLGKMGANMAQRLIKSGHKVTGFDPSAAARSALKRKKGGAVDSLKKLVDTLPTPRVVWMMVPAGKITDDTVDALKQLLEKGDTLIDGGNSNYKDTLQRAADCQEEGIHYVDCGTSGGVWGLKEGYSMMVGGDKKVVGKLKPIFQSLAPGKNKGWGHVGPVGAGHFVKMVHNGIEYGMMQAYAEGFSVLKHKQEFELDLAQVGEIWRYGSVVRSWLLELATDALGKNPNLEGIAPFVADSGEGRWTVDAAIELNVPIPVITLSLMERFRSRDDDSFSDKLLASMRNEFGGHAIKKQ